MTVDARSQTSALDRAQPCLPFMTCPGFIKVPARTMTHDDKLHVTTTAFAALDAATATVINACLPRHRAKEFLTSRTKFYRETS